MNNQISQRGFIALMSIIIISVVLILGIVSSGLIGYYSRFNTLDSELKERSVAAADGCVDRALLQLAQDPNYTGGVMSLNSIDQCRIGKVSTIGSNTQFYVQATSSNTAVTNLQIVVASSDLSVISWEEIPNY